MRKTKFIKIRATAEDQALWSAVADASGKSVSALLRDYVEGQAKRMGLVVPDAGSKQAG